MAVSDGWTHGMASRYNPRYNYITSCASYVIIYLQHATVTFNSHDMNLSSKIWIMIDKSSVALLHSCVCRFYPSL